jgi:hypothetical protein
VLARWSGWGAVPKVFDEADQHFAAARAELKTLLVESEWRAAGKTTLNANYTDAALAAVMWDAVRAGGLGGPLSRPAGPGARTRMRGGHFPRPRPRRPRPRSAADRSGTRLDHRRDRPTPLPRRGIRTESFADTGLPDSFRDLVIGNVPSGKIALHDKAHNPAGHSLHNHFILKSLALTRPGGVVAVLTSHYTMDSINPAARRDIADRADLITAIRLPISAHQRAAGTQVISDLLVLRRRDPADGPSDITEWEGTVRICGDEERNAPAGWNNKVTERLVACCASR